MASSKKNNYLITGGLGFIGSNIAKLLIKRKNVQKCILVDNFGGYINPLRWTYQDFRKLRFTDIKVSQKWSLPKVSSYILPVHLGIQ